MRWRLMLVLLVVAATVPSALMAVVAVLQSSAWFGLGSIVELGALE